MTIVSFKELKVWKKSHELALEIYKISHNFPNYEIYSLVSQLRRCAVSVPSNIVEGFKRKSLKDSLHFYNIAEGSLEELKYQLLLSKDLGYISNFDYDRLFRLSEEVGRLVNCWKKSQKF